MKKIESLVDDLLKRKISRKQFLKMCMTGAASLTAGSILGHHPALAEETFTGRPKSTVKGVHDLVAAEGNDPYLMTVEAIKVFGGMEKFVKKGDVVVIKPNIAWDRTPEQAANTNPRVVVALIDLCFKAGAKRVNVFDNTCNSARACYKNSGISEAAKKAGARVFFIDEWNVVKAAFKYKSPMEGWPIRKDAVKCDTFINVPVLKHHRLARLTISQKNLMGICTGSRGKIHGGIGRKLVDITDFISPDLTVIDAYRVLVRGGPVGGNLKDVENVKTVMVATDSTLADTYAARLIGVDPMALPNLVSAKERKFGSMDVKNADISKIKI